MTDPTIDWNALLADLTAEVAVTAIFDPRERLPKEEQVRCAAYRSLHQHSTPYCVRAEPSYFDVDSGRTEECDLRAFLPTQEELWIELKMGPADLPGYQRKPGEAFRSWASDIDRLAFATGNNVVRAFILTALRAPESRSRLYSATQFAQIDEHIARRFPTSVRRCYSHSRTIPFWRETRDPLIFAMVWVWRTLDAADVG